MEVWSLAAWKMMEEKKWRPAAPEDQLLQPIVPARARPPAVDLTNRPAVQLG